MKKALNKSSLDRIAAEIGFMLCDVPNAIYRATADKISKCKNADELKQQNLALNDVSKYISTEKYNFLIEKIMKIVNPLEDVKRMPSRQFSELKERPKKLDAKEYEREVNKALGILIEDGLFAYSIWLESENKEPHRVMQTMSLTLLKDSEIGLIKDSTDLRNGILKEISTSIDKTLFARQLLERMLIYAMYRAKALQKGETE